MLYLTKYEYQYIDFQKAAFFYINVYFRYTEMDKISREREEIIERAKNGYLEREKVLQEANQALNSKLEDGLIRERQLDWKLQDLARDKEMQIEK